MVQICTHIILNEENDAFTNVNTTFFTIYVLLHIALRYFLEPILDSSSWYKFLENKFCIKKMYCLFFN